MSASPPRHGVLPGRWLPEVRAALAAILSTPSVPLCVTDWDNTCVRGDVGEAALQWLDAADGGERMHRYERLIETEGKTVAYRWCAEVVAGRTEVDLRALCERFLSAGLRAGSLVERPEIRDLVWTLQRHGWEVWVVSASQETLVQTAAQRYGIPADHVVGMVLGVGEDGVLLPTVAGPITFRHGKVDAIDARIGRRPTLAIGDAETDLEMMESAEHALLIDRGDEDLRRHAEERGWWIQPAFEDQLTRASA